MSTSVNLLPYLLMGAECKCLSIRAFSLLGIHIIWLGILLCTNVIQSAHLEEKEADSVISKALAQFLAGLE